MIHLHRHEPSQPTASALTLSDSLNRRELSDPWRGVLALALTYLLESERLLAAPAVSSSAKAADFPAKAKSVIFLFMEGGPSHLDTFDPKPKLREMAGQKLPDSFSKN
jgi:hypothetical protein